MQASTPAHPAATAPVGGAAAAELIRDESNTDYKIEYQEGDTAWHVYTRHYWQQKAESHMAELRKDSQNRNWRIVKHTVTNREEVVAATR